MQERQTERFLSGGLNLLNPGDALPSGDAMEMLNWRCDQQGQLRSRKNGVPLDTNTYATPIHTRFFQNIATPWDFTGGADKLYRNEVPILGGFDGYHLGLVNWVGYLWVMNRAQQGRISANDNVFRPWLPAPAAAPALALSATAGALAGTYNYYITFDTVEGFESDLSPMSAPISVDGIAATAVDLSAIAVSADPSVVARHIYREGGYMDELYRVGTLADNTTVVFTDTMGDEDAAIEGITHSADHRPPPACRGLAGMYDDMMLAYSSKAHPNWFWWTPADKPWYWPGSDLDDGNHAPVGEDGEEILAVSIKPRVVVFYKAKTIWRMVGSPDDTSGELEWVAQDIGILGPTAWASAGPIDYIVAAEGVYSFNTEQATKVSGKLDPLFKGDSIELGADNIFPVSIDPAARALTVCCIRNGRLYVSYVSSASTDGMPDTTLILETETGEWYRDNRGFTSLCSRTLTAGDFTGSIGNRFYAVESDGPGPITVGYQSRYSDQSAPENLKMYSDLVIDHDTGGGALQVQLLFNRGTSSQVLGEISSTGYASTVFPISGSGYEARNVSLRLDGTVTAPVFLFAAHLHYYLTGRMMLTYDSGVVDLGAQTHQIAQISADLLTGGAAATWALYCDQNGSLTEMASGTFASAGGRQRPVQSMPQQRIFQGRLARVVIQSSMPFRLYGASLWTRPVGLWLPAGTTFTLPPNDLGSRREKLLKEIAFELNGSLAVTASTDVLPAMASGTLTGVDSWDKLAMPRFARGGRVSLTLSAVTDTIVYGGKVRAKSIGEASPTDFDWAALPIEPTPPNFQWSELPVNPADFTQARVKYQ